LFLNSSITLHYRQNAKRASEIKISEQRRAQIDCICMALTYTDIESTTRGQSENTQWHKERISRVTASNFYDILHARDQDNFTSSLYQRKSKFTSPSNLAACKFGVDSEKPAFELYARQMGARVQYAFQPGLCVSTMYKGLAATPDFIVYSDAQTESQLPTSTHNSWLVEIKSFVTNDKAETLYQLAKLRNGNFCMAPLCDGTLVLRRDHKFFYQIIGQLNILYGPDPMAYCDLVLYYRGDITIVRIYNDVHFWLSIVQSLMMLAGMYVSKLSIESA
jgi:YqaJ-like viral recombinase domain